MNLTIELKFNDDFKQRIDTNYFYHAEVNHMKGNLINWIDYYKSGGYNLYNNNELAIETLNDRCNMTYPLYMSHPMSACERQINLIIARSPQFINSIDRNKSHPSIRKQSHIAFKK